MFKMILCQNQNSTCAYSILYARLICMYIYIHIVSHLLLCKSVLQLGMFMKNLWLNQNSTCPYCFLYPDMCINIHRLFVFMHIVFHILLCYNVYVYCSQVFYDEIVPKLELHLRLVYIIVRHCYIFIYTLFVLIVCHVFIML